jgi:hypothetical protein
MLIGLTGLARSGKSTAADYLVKDKKYIRVPFAAPLKRMLRSLGLNDLEINGTLKEEPCDLLGGRSPRYAMQRLGTEWGRDLIHPNIWVELWRRDSERLIAAGHSVVADDCRFENEAKVLRDLGGKIVHIRNGENVNTSITPHSSEGQPIIPDARVLNDLISFDTFYARLDGILESLGGRHEGR